MQQKLFVQHYRAYMVSRSFHYFSPAHSISFQLKSTFAHRKSTKATMGFIRLWYTLYLPDQSDVINTELVRFLKQLLCYLSDRNQISRSHLGIDSYCFDQK